MIKIYDFYAEWCGPCKMMAPMIQEAVSKYKVELLKIDVEENNDMVLEYNIGSVPTLIFFKDGVEVSRLVGFQPVQKISEEIEKILNKS
jgi:thioredoxin 1